MKSNFSVEQGVGYRLIDVGVDCDFAAADAFEAALSSDDADRRPSIVDLTSCEFIDSKGLEALVRRHRAKRDVIVVLPPGHRLQRIFELTGLGVCFPLVATREFALELVQSGAKSPTNAM